MVSAHWGRRRHSDYRGRRKDRHATGSSTETRLGKARYARQERPEVTFRKCGEPHSRIRVGFRGPMIPGRTRAVSSENCSQVRHGNPPVRPRVLGTAKLPARFHGAIATSASDVSRPACLRWRVLASRTKFAACCVLVRDPPATAAWRQFRLGRARRTTAPGNGARSGRRPPRSAGRPSLPSSSASEASGNDRPRSSPARRLTEVQPGDGDGG
jgi:hypothetical protein